MGVSRSVTDRSHVRLPRLARLPRRRALCCLAVAGLLAGCGGAGEDTGTATIHLVDQFADQKAHIWNRAAAAEIEPVEWRFDGASDDPAWNPGPGVRGAEVDDGRLVGRTIDDFPVLAFDRRQEAGGDDLLDSVEVRMRASAGANLSVQFSSAEEVDLEGTVAQGRVVPWRITTPIVAGTGMRTYVLDADDNPFSTHVGAIRHLLLRPTDAKDAEVEIESVRLVSRSDHLSRIDSGVSWQGLSEIYHETLVTHAPERVTFTLRAPRSPRLSLSVGTIEEAPVTFRVVVRAAGGQGRDEVLAEHRVDDPGRWEPVAVDLSDYEGREVDLTFSLDAARPGALGFWGSPVVQSTRRSGEARAGEPPQGVILILADTLRQDHLSTYGYGRETDPLLRRLAGEGALFEDCQVEGTWTKVATPSIFSSLYPLSHGVFDFDHRLPASAVTVGEAFRDAGRSTLLLSSIMFTGKFSGLHQGFQEVHEAASLAERRSSKTAAELVERLIPWLERHRDVPFFVVLHVLDPHDPYRPKPPYDALWADGDRAEEHEARALEVRAAIADPLLQVFGMPSKDEVAAAGFDPDDYIGYEMDWYDGAIRGMDDALGRLVDYLGESGLDRRTVVALTADHGEEFFDHGRTFHGQGLYGELTNVPLILWGPGRIPAATVVETPVQTVDVMPTLLDLSGAPIPEAAQGRSLVTLVEAAAAGRPAPPGAVRPVFSIRAPTQDLFGPPPRAKEAYSIILDGWKLIQNVRGVEGDPELELYDHDADPLDQNDVVSEHPEVARRLAEVLTRWRRSMEAKRLPSDDEAASSLSGDELKRLRSLGYIE